MMANVWMWVGFNLFVLAMLALDLGVFHRKTHAVSLKEAAVWSGIWISLALAFNVLIYFWRGPEPALEFLAGYLLEKSLSVDNIFVFVLIFSTFSVPAIYQHRVLFWGILGALVMRGALIAAGTVLFERFDWIIYVFGAFLVYTGIKMAFHKETEMHPEDNPIVKLARRVLPITRNYEGDRFFVRQAGRLMVTPLLLVLIVVETTDLVFALDSIPAVFGVTRDPFIVYTSNVFAILGLRALYFLLAGVVHKFYYLRLGLSAILAFVGAKMVLADVFHLPVTVSLSVIAGILVVSIAASLLRTRRETAESERPAPREPLAD